MKFQKTSEKKDFCKMTNCEKLIVIIMGYVCFSNCKSSMLIILAILLETIWNTTLIGGINHSGF